MAFSILWFKNDFRINDNPALNAAFSFGLPVIPIYIMDDNDIGAASKLWLHYSLKSLQESLNGNLSFFKEDAESTIKKIINQNDIKAFFWNRSYDKKSIDRDKKIKELLNKSKLLIHTSKLETFGLVAVEANAMGVPVLTTNSGSLLEIVEHNKNGFYSENLIDGNVNNYVKDLLNNNKKFDEITRNCLEKSKRYNWAETAKEIEKEN